MVCKLKRSIYGLMQVEKGQIIWFFEQNLDDPCCKAYSQVSKENKGLYACLPL